MRVRIYWRPTIEIWIVRSHGLLHYIARAFDVLVRGIPLTFLSSRLTKLKDIDNAKEPSQLTYTSDCHDFQYMTARHSRRVEIELKQSTISTFLCKLRNHQRTTAKTWQTGTDEVHLRSALYFLFMLGLYIHEYDYC